MQGNLSVPHVTFPLSQVPHSLYQLKDGWHAEKRNMMRKKSKLKGCLRVPEQIRPTAMSA